MPKTWPSQIDPSAKVTETLSTLSTTWAFVRTKPFSLMITPEPCPLSLSGEIPCSPSKSLNKGSSKVGSNCCLSTKRSVSIFTTAGPISLTADDTKLWLSKEVKAKTSASWKKLSMKKQEIMKIWIKLINLILRYFISLMVFGVNFINLIEERDYCCFFVYIHKMQIFKFFYRKNFLMCENKF